MTIVVDAMLDKRNTFIIFALAKRSFRKPLFRNQILKAMRFFDRTEEIASLKEIQEQSKSNAQFTVVTGRRRIGKTHLVWKAYEDQPILYFFVARKAESDLCSDYILEIETKLGIPTMGGKPALA